jgi:hypothetical protein
MVNCDELIGTLENLTLQARCRVNRDRYNLVGLFTVIRVVLCPEMLHHRLTSHGKLGVTLH